MLGSIAQTGSMRCASLVLLSLLPALGGCGALTLIHDAYIGPISPAGRVHALTVGSNFRVTSKGPVADRPAALLTPLPPSMFQRMASMIPLTRGLRAAVASFSFVVGRARRVGAGPVVAEGEDLRGWTLAEVLERLGPPQTWISRRSGSILAYSADSAEDFGFFIGMPPGVANLVPIPGIGNLRFRYLETLTERAGLLLFLDREGRVSAWFRSD